LLQLLLLFVSYFVGKFSLGLISFGEPITVSDKGISSFFGVREKSTVPKDVSLSSNQLEQGRKCTHYFPKQNSLFWSKNY